jgi:hypothetical protein
MPIVATEEAGLVGPTRLSRELSDRVNLLTEGSSALLSALRLSHFRG